MWNGKDMIIYLIVGLIKKTLSWYFLKLFRIFGGNTNVKVDFSSSATKIDFKHVRHIDSSSLALKTKLASIKTEVNNLDIDTLVSISVDLSKMSDVVKNDVVKKTVYNKLVGKVNNIDPSNFSLKTKYQTDKTELEKKNPNETRHIKRYGACKWKCRLHASVCNNKQRWNEDKCRCECKELIDKGVCDKRFV